MKSVTFPPHRQLYTPMFEFLEKGMQDDKGETLMKGSVKHRGTIKVRET